MHSIFGRRQRMIRTETQHWIENWITDHPEVYCYADGMLAASYPTGEMIINLRQSTPSYMEDDVGFRVMLHRTKTDIASWRERWFGEQRELSYLNATTNADRARIRQPSHFCIPYQPRSLAFMPSPRTGRWQTFVIEMYRNPEYLNT